MVLVIALVHRWWHQVKVRSSREKLARAGGEICQILMSRSGQTGAFLTRKSNEETHLSVCLVIYGLAWLSIQTTPLDFYFSVQAWPMNIYSVYTDEFRCNHTHQSRSWWNLICSRASNFGTHTSHWWWYLLVFLSKTRVAGCIWKLICMDDDEVNFV